MLVPFFLQKLLILAVSRPDSSAMNATEGVGHHTYLYARRRTFFSWAHHIAQFTHSSALFQCCHIGIGSRYKGSVSRIFQNHCQLFMSLSGVPFIRFPPVAFVKGFTDPDLTEIRSVSPTRSRLSRQLISQLSASRGFRLRKGDVKTAFFVW